ncbi:hypothetical protein [Cellulophaga omnivescoria]|uniref:hypothetical protein n=1 Tax=Cellulophaga omnivescoria TaxID=1888890 RepID=UPI0009873658|nr:hypothetical protein [Cellulophaga omnivescoria]WBU88199.1 hypothetical protein PBN93_09985 [Cellulophaga omnivescoria]WKB80179.1 hypothetical protein QYR09_10495 [Cellulophaga lytica]
MKLKEITLSVFSVVMIGFLLLGSQNIHTLSYHADDDGTAIVHCEQCDFIFTNNHTSFTNYSFTTIVTPYIFTGTKAKTVTNYKKPKVKNTVTPKHLNKPPPAV